MIQIKKTILTLALLLTAATGAWAQSAVASIGSENYTTLQAAFTAAETGQTIKLLSDVTQTGGVGKSDGKAVTFDLNGHIYTCTEDYVVMATSNSQITIIDSSTGTPGGIKSEVALIGMGNGKIIIKAGRYNIGGSTAEELLEYFPLWGVEMYSGYTLQDITPADAQGFCVAVVAPASTGPEVAWDKAEKTGTFKMPGGNVTLEPEYYPQATAAEGAVTAATGVAATTEDALVTIDETKLTGAAKMMYYVSTEATAPAYDAEGWTDVLPTAEKYTEAANLNVWYYPVGTDEGVGGATATYSDGDMNATALTVTLAAAPTFNVTFAEGTNPEAPAEPEWTASPNTDVTKGQTVTVTYSGSKKVIGVKAEKKAAAKPVTLATALEDGAIIKVYFKWRNQNKGDYVQGVYNAASGTFTASKGGSYWGKDGRAVYKVEKSGDNIIIGAGFFDYNTEGMVWTFNTTNDTYTTTNGAEVNQFPTEYGLISVSVNDTDITSQLTAQ